MLVASALCPVRRGGSAVPYLKILAVAGIVSSISVWAMSPPTLTFMSKTYQLASFSHMNRPMWEFASPPETVDNWTSMVTLVECPGTHTNADVDKVAEGLVSIYRENHAQILMSKTMTGKSGKPYDYLVAAFEEPTKHRFEIDFVRVALMEDHQAWCLIYGKRIADAEDYLAKSKVYLNQHSSEVGQALEAMSLPSKDNFPRKEF
jgi:hypothetical protein